MSELAGWLRIEERERKQMSIFTVQKFPGNMQGHIRDGKIRKSFASQFT